MKLNTYLQKMRHLSSPANRIFCLGLGLCCWLLCCAVVLLVISLPLSIRTYGSYVLAMQLERMTLAVFICTAFLGCFVEEQMLKR